MEILLSAYEKTTHQLMFRVYAEPLPDTGRRQSHRAAHFAALDLLGAALAEDFGVYHAVIRRSGLGKPQLIHIKTQNPRNIPTCVGKTISR